MLHRAVLLIGMLVGLAVPAWAQPTKLSVAYVSAADFVTAFAAKDHGFFDRHGLDVTLIKMPIATNIPAALMSNSLDIGMSTVTILLQSTAGGLDFVAIEGVSRFYVDKPKVSVVARAGSGITTAQDLIGKRIGVPGLNSVMDVGVQAWLLQNKVPLDRVTRLEANFPQMSDLLANHSLDAVAVLEPFRSKIIDSGVGTKVADYFSDLGVNALSAIWMTTRPWAEAHRPAVAQFRAALEDAATFLAANPDARKPLEVKYLGYASPVPPSISLDIEPKDFAWYSETMKRLGLLDRPIDVDTLVFR